MNELRKNNKKLYVKREDVMKLLMNHIGYYSVNDLGCWLETKTANNFTTIELEFIKNTFTILEVIIKNATESIDMFKKQWNDKLAKVEGYSKQ